MLSSHLWQNIRIFHDLIDNVIDKLILIQDMKLSTFRILGLNPMSLRLYSIILTIRRTLDVLFNVVVKIANTLSRLRLVGLILLVQFYSSVILIGYLNAWAIPIGTWQQVPRNDIVAINIGDRTSMNSLIFTHLQVVSHFLLIDRIARIPIILQRKQRDVVWFELLLNKIVEVRVGLCLPLVWLCNLGCELLVWIEHKIVLENEWLVFVWQVEAALIKAIDEISADILPSSLNLISWVASLRKPLLSEFLFVLLIV